MNGAKRKTRQTAVYSRRTDTQTNKIMEACGAPHNEEALLQYKAENGPITKLESPSAPRHYPNARQVNTSMEGVVKGMGSALKTMDVERISKTMDNFEQQFEDMDVRAGYMENAMSNSTSMSTPQEQVDGLIQMVADEAGLELGEQLDDAGPVSSKVPAKPEAAPAPAAADGEDELANRLAALRK